MVSFSQSLAVAATLAVSITSVLAAPVDAFLNERAISNITACENGFYVQVSQSGQDYDGWYAAQYRGTGVDLVPVKVAASVFRLDGTYLRQGIGYVVADPSYEFSVDWALVPLPTVYGIYGEMDSLSCSLDASTAILSCSLGNKIYPNVDPGYTDDGYTYPPDLGISNQDSGWTLKAVCLIGA